MKIAILGTRGIPASYSGFETAAEQLASRLVARGHEVTVYCRPHVVDRSIREWKGARLVHLPTCATSTWTPSCTRSSRRCTRAAAASPTSRSSSSPATRPLCLITRGAGIPTVINVDGLDSDRRKWPALAKRLPALGRAQARRAGPTAPSPTPTRWPEVFEQRYGRAHRRRSLRGRGPGARRARGRSSAWASSRAATSSSSGAWSPRTTRTSWSRRSRASAPSGRGGMKLVVVGGAPYADDYIEQVMRESDPRVIFPGYVFGRGYWELQRHAYLFCAPTEVGGTHPVILEAMAAGNCVLVNDHPPERRDGRRRRGVLLGSRGRGGPGARARRAARRPAHRGRVPAPRPGARPPLLLGGAAAAVRGAAGGRGGRHARAPLPPRPGRPAGPGERRPPGRQNGRSAAISASRGARASRSEGVTSSRGHSIPRSGSS